MHCKCIGCRGTESPTSFEDERVAFTIGWMPMMLKILLHRFFRDVARAPRAVAYRPEVPPPISLAQGRVFFLKSATRAPLHPLDQVRHRLRRRVLDVHVDVVFAHHA